MTSRPLLAVALACALGSPPAAHAQLPADSAIFRVTTNEFWLNLHHFLYVLARAQGGEPDAAREAVAQAPIEASRTLAGLSAADQTTWKAAVTTYAERLGKLDPVFDRALFEITNTLVGAGVQAPVPYGGPDTAIAGALRRAAPIYRDAWWPEHEVANRRWADSQRALVRQHGDQVLGYIRRAYRLPWPANGYPVRVVAYANWAGAYSTYGELLIVSSRPPSTQGLLGLEITFHEAMHQWDDSVSAVIRQQASRLGVTAPRSLSHLLIFFTAGEAVRHVVPSHVPYAERFELWPRLGPPRTVPALTAIWKPYLEGVGERDAVIGQLVDRLSARLPTPPATARPSATQANPAGNAPAMPSTASSEWGPKPVVASPMPAVP